MSSTLMAASWNGAALSPAWLLAVYAVSLQLMVIQRVRANERDASMVWVLGGALVVGTGMWAASFLSLVAMQLPIKVGYVRDVVLASWLPAIVVAASAIWMQTNAGLRLRSRLLGALLVAVGLQMLVFVNASSIMLQPALVWDPTTSAAAFLLSFLGCGLGALLLQPRNEGGNGQVHDLAVSVLVGTIIWAGLALQVSAAGVPFAAICLSEGQLSGESLEFVLTATVLLLLVMTHMSARQDERSQARNRSLSASLQAAQTALEEACLRDATSGLPNRAGFEQQVNQIIDAVRDQALSMAVLRLNVDGYHAFTGTYGHGVGDGLIQTLSLRLQCLIREGDVLARSDTDEFLIACQGLSDEHVIAVMAQRLQDSMHEPCLVQDQEIAISCSIGVARYPDSATTEQLMSHSNDAMLTARRAGGGVYCFFERGMDRVGAAQVEMQRDLRHAVARKELILHFQPKLRASTGELAGVEALLRWQHPTRGMVSPVEFIPVAERFGIIGELGQWVIEEACRHLRLWHELGLDIPVAVNLSVHQLRQPDLEQRVREALRRHRVPPRMLIMEITESVAMEDIEASLRVFDMLDQIGVRLSIDDFGTGYSSLSYLRRLPARQLKIDRSFVRDLDSSLDAQAIVEAVVRLAHALDLKVVAEGVETQDQADILAHLKCDELQGFLFARPMSDQILMKWLGQRGTPMPVATNAPLAAPDEEGIQEALDHATAWSQLEANGP
jgi:diguanylate cyclase (GGDEF)-like protein